MTVEEFKSVAGEFGIPVNMHDFGRVNFSPVGNTYSFSYCGVNFSFDSKGGVSVKGIPFYALESICSNYPDNPFGIVTKSEDEAMELVKRADFRNKGIEEFLQSVEEQSSYSPYTGATDAELENDMMEIEKADFSKQGEMLTEAYKRFWSRPDSGKYIKSCSVGEKDGLIAIIGEVTKCFKSLADWARINKVETGTVGEELREAANCFDKSFSVDSLVDGRGRNVSETENCVSCFQNNNVWYRQVSFFDEDGKKVIFTHYCVKRNAGPLKFNGEGVNIEIYNGEELVTDAVYPFDGTLSKDNIEFIKKAFAKASDYVTDIEAEKKVSNRK